MLDCVRSDPLLRPPSHPIIPSFVRARAHTRAWESKDPGDNSICTRVHNDNSFSWQRLATPRDAVNGLNGESVSIESWKLTWRWAKSWRFKGPFRCCVSVLDGTDYSRRSKLESMGVELAFRECAGQWCRRDNELLGNEGWCKASVMIDLGIRLDDSIK